jgi:hypothetical protein
MRRLCEQLGVWTGPYREFTERAPNHVWSAAMWDWLVTQSPGGYCLQLQDDVELAPNFRTVLEAMLQAVPNEVIGLETAHPGAMTVAREGGRWCTTADGLIGVGYVLPSALLQDFLEWCDRELKLRSVLSISEDTLIGVWALATGRRIWHPVPTIIDHDLSIASTYGNDAHTMRRPSVTWRDGDILGWSDEQLEDVAFWRLPLDPLTGASTRPHHLGRFYAATSQLATMHTRSFTLEQAKVADADVCAGRYARFFR